MEKMRNVLDHTLEILSGVSFLAMVVLTCWQVFTRYLLKIRRPGPRNWCPICSGGWPFLGRPW